MYFDDVRQKFFAAVDQLEPETVRTMRSAFELAEKEHQGQVRKQHRDRPDELDPYLVHPLRVSLILLNELSLCDVTALSSAVLHDVVEDGNSRPTIADIAAAFGKEIASAVSYLTKPEPQNGKSEAETLIPYHESFFAAPLLVRLVKLSDRLDNMRETLLIDRPKFQSRYLKETREIYLPLAKQTSLFFCAQLENQCEQLERLLPLHSGVDGTALKGYMGRQ